VLLRSFFNDHLLEVNDHMTLNEFLNTDAVVVKAMLRAGLMTNQEHEQLLEAWRIGNTTANRGTGELGAGASRVRFETVS
jgi:hypothetical protein